MSRPGILGGRVEPGIASGILVPVEEHDVFVLVQHVPRGCLGILGDSWGFTGYRGENIHEPSKTGDHMITILCVYIYTYGEDQ